MKEFLRQVAEHYLERGFDNRLFVFPNRRSIVFFKKHIGDLLRERGLPPVIAPRMLAVNEFFFGMTGQRTADRISLLLKLYDCYCTCYTARYNGLPETLDDFIFWGDTIISDFDDVDKYLVDASQLFQNIADLKDISADYSFLSEIQQAAMEKLSDHFLARNRKIVAEGKQDIKANFLKSWNILFYLYESFRSALASEGLAYEGMIYRDLVNRLENEDAAALLKSLEPRAEKCVIVGLNALSASEIKILKALQKAGLTEFCWDFAGPFFEGKDAPKLKFVKENVKTFPNAFKIEAPDSKPAIHVCSVPSATGQAKILAHITAGIPESERGIDTAVVLPDESMLIPVLDSMPANVGTVNVTMGYSLGTSEWGALMQAVVNLQLHTRGQMFYHKQVYDLLSSSILKAVMTDEERTCVNEVKVAARAYIPVQDLQRGEIFKVLFRPVITDMNKADGEQSAAIAHYLGEVIETLAASLKGDHDDIHLECAYRYLRCVTTLEGLGLKLMPKNFFRMLDSLVARVSVPFAGEPLGGLQVMGPLETRALDFRHVVLLNANEGTFPGKAVSNSLVPPELRKAFGLPTYELQDSIWTYYFYRMICRAEDVWMIYDSRVEGMNSGEESRFVKQLRYLYADKCVLSDEVAGCGVSTLVDDVIKKTAADIEAIRNAEFSPSSIHKYISCPVQFYYHTVKKLYVEDEVHEDMDKGMVGNVCHDTLQALYSSDKAMDPDYEFDKRRDATRLPARGMVDEAFYNYWLSSEGLSRIRLKVDALSCRQLKTPQLEGRNLVLAQVAMHYVKKVLEADKALLKKHGILKVVETELPIHGTIAGHKFNGYIDRLDSFGDGGVRVVDYKTGSDVQTELDTVKVESIVKEVFQGEKKAAFQFFVYDSLLKQSEMWKGQALSNSMYSVRDLFFDDIKVYPASDDLAEAMTKGLEELFGVMENPDVPFVRKPGSNNDNCRYCNYKMLCGKFVKEKK